MILANKFLTVTFTQELLLLVHPHDELSFHKIKVSQAGEFNGNTQQASLEVRSGLANGTAREWHDREWHNSVTVMTKRT
jgi:hypothetical protein